MRELVVKSEVVPDSMLFSASISGSSFEKEPECDQDIKMDVG